MSEPILPLAAPDDQVALVEPAAGLRVTYGELAAEVERLGRVLVARGVVPGDVVAFSMANGPEIVTTFLAVVAAGAAAAPLNPGYTAKEFAFYLDDLQPRLVIGRGDDAPELPGAVDLADLDGDPGGSLPAPDADAVALLLHTSGTTARPKQVPIRQRNLMASARTVAATYALTRRRHEPLRDAAVPRPRAGRLDARDARDGRHRALPAAVLAPNAFWNDGAAARRDLVLRRADDPPHPDDPRARGIGPAGARAAVRALVLVGARGTADGRVRGALRDPAASRPTA